MSTPPPLPRVFALCGSLRAKSSNLTILRAFARATAAKLDVVFGPGIDELPHFNPDLDGDAPPASVVSFRNALRETDALVISCPEYVHGMPGAFKNALEWLVSDVAFMGKPIALINASPESTYADAQLRHTLEVMNARLLNDACITLPLGVRRFDEAQLIAAPAVAAQFAAMAGAIVVATKNKSGRADNAGA